MTTFNCDVCHDVIPTRAPRWWLGIRSGVTNQPVPHNLDESRVDLCERCARIYGTETLVVDKLRAHLAATPPPLTVESAGLPQESEEVREAAKPDP